MNSNATIESPKSSAGFTPSGGSDVVSELNRKLLVSLGLSEASAKIVMTRICELDWANKRLVAALQICQAESEMMWSNVNVMTPEHQYRLARISDASTNALKHQNEKASTASERPKNYEIENHHRNCERETEAAEAGSVLRDAAT